MESYEEFLDMYFTGEPKEVAEAHLWEMLNDIDSLDGFRGGVWGPDDIIDNLRNGR